MLLNAQVVYKGPKRDEEDTGKKGKGRGKKGKGKGKKDKDGRTRLEACFTLQLDFGQRMLEVKAALQECLENELRLKSGLQVTGRTAAASPARRCLVYVEKTQEERESARRRLNEGTAQASGKGGGKGGK